MKLILLLFFMLSVIFIHAQGIRGTVTDSDKTPVAYANIYVPALKTGTTSNINGEFELKLPKGEWEVLFQYIGYKTVVQNVNTDVGTAVVDITLFPQNIHIKEIKVLASGEDPAYYVMRRAIAMAPYYNSQVAEYNCKLYLKGTGVVDRIPRLFKKQMEKEGIKKDKPFSMESVNRIHFELPDKLDQQVIAMRSTGNDNQTNPMQMITTNLYNVSKYGVSSPVARNALSVYRFELAGVFEDQGKLINKVKVMPKVKGQQGTFEGFVNIVDGYWNIHSADLRFSMPMTEVTMRQMYSLVDINAWMPTSFNFDIKFNALGFGLKYNYVASFSEYEVKLNEKLDHSFLRKMEEREKQEAAVLDSIVEMEEFLEEKKAAGSKNQQQIAELLEKEELSNREMYKLEKLMDKEAERSLPPEPLEITERVQVSKSAVNNDAGFWNELRPIPLTEAEESEFSKKDSLILASSTPEYKDSIRDIRMKFKVKDLFLGRTYKYGNDSIRFRSDFSIPGLLYRRAGSFNTVDGVSYGLPFSFSLNDSTGRSFRANASGRYAFSRETAYGEAFARYNYNGLKRRWVSISGGKKLEDFKGAKGISSEENELYTLFFEDNFQKFYEKKFLNLSGGTEIINGMQFRGSLEFSNRTPVKNNSSYTFIDWKDKNYTPNVPETVVDEFLLTGSRSLTAGFEINYTPRQRYRIRDHIKYPADSNFPTFNLQYKKGIKDLAGSDVDFDLLKLGLTQQVRVGFDSHLRYFAEAGKYLNNNQIYFADYTFFNSNDQFLTLTDFDRQFALPAYYRLFSNKHYLEAHAALDMNKFLLKRLPVLNGTMIREKLKMHYMTSESVSNYLELSYGLNGIFLLFDVEFVGGFNNWKDFQTGVRIGINLK